jgi:hypothetical protein
LAADPTPGKNLYELQIIAYDGANCPQQDGIGTNRHQIAVKADVNDDPKGQFANQLIRQNDILLSAGDDFQVIDGNACNDGVARFQLPPVGDLGGNLEDPTFQEYGVYARLVGKPQTGVNVTTCATEAGEDLILGTDDDIIVCSTESYVDVRMKGTKPQWQNVSKKLLTVCLDTDLVAGCDTRLALFDPALQDYFWNWNTTGKAHAQLVFVAIPD